MTDDTSQLHRAALASMTPDEISDAYDAGRLAVTLGERTPEEAALIARATTGTVTLADVHALTAIGRHDLINDAHRSDRITFTTQET